MTSVTPTVDRASLRRAFLASLSGTSLEWYDFAAYSVAAATVCALNGARILRMHDVGAAVAAARMLETVLGFAEPAYLRHNVT